MAELKTQRNKKSVEAVLSLHVISGFEQHAALLSKLGQQSVAHVAKANGRGGSARTAFTGGNLP